MFLVKAGGSVDQAIAKLLPHLKSPGIDQSVGETPVSPT